MMKRIFLFGVLAVMMLSFISTALAQTNQEALGQACILKYGGNWDNLNVDQKKECNNQQKDSLNIIDTESIKTNQKEVMPGCTPILGECKNSGCIGPMGALKINWNIIAYEKSRNRLMEGDYNQFIIPYTQIVTCSFKEKCGIPDSELIKRFGIGIKECPLLGKGKESSISLTTSIKKTSLTLPKGKYSYSLNVNLPGLSSIKLNDWGLETIRRLNLNLLAAQMGGSSITIEAANLADSPKLNLEAAIANNKAYSLKFGVRDMTDKIGGYAQISVPLSL